MGHFSALTDRNFKKDASGLVHYFPFGAFAGGRVITGPGTELRLRRFLKISPLVGVPALLAFCVLNTYVVAAAVAYAAATYGGIYYLLSGCRPSTERLTHREYAEKTAGGNAFLLGYGLLGGTLLILAGLFLVIAGRQLHVRLLGLFCAAIFSYLCFVTAWALWLKGRQSA